MHSPTKFINLCAHLILINSNPMREALLSSELLEEETDA